MIVLGVDLGGTQMRVAQIDSNGKIIKQDSAPTLAEKGKDNVISRLIKLIKDNLTPEIQAVGLGMPGPLDLTAKTVINPPNLPGWHIVPIVDIIQKELNIPVILERDANCALVGEHWIGAAKGLQDVALITWGTGVGGALIISNRIYHGPSGVAGELGHMIIDYNGSSCHLGHSGCLESFIGGLAVSRRYGQSFQDIVTGFHHEEPQAIKAIVEITQALKVGVQNIITIFAPELIVFTGSVTKSIDVFLPAIKDYPIKVSHLAGEAGLLGAARLALDFLEKK